MTRNLCLQQLLPVHKSQLRKLLFHMVALATRPPSNKIYLISMLGQSQPEKRLPRQYKICGETYATQAKGSKAADTICLQTIRSYTKKPPRLSKTTHSNVILSAFKTRCLAAVKSSMATSWLMLASSTSETKHHAQHSTIILKPSSDDQEILQCLLRFVLKTKLRTHTTTTT